GPQRAGVVGLHRKRLAARRRHARPRPRQVSLARHAGALSLRRRRHLARGQGRDGDEDRQVDHRPLAGAGVIPAAVLLDSSPLARCRCREPPFDPWGSRRGRRRQVRLCSNRHCICQALCESKIGERERTILKQEPRLPCPPMWPEIHSAQSSLSPKPPPSWNFPNSSRHSSKSSDFWKKNGLSITTICVRKIRNGRTALAGSWPCSEQSRSS